jgi:hypothetical protein
MNALDAATARSGLAEAVLQAAELLLCQAMERLDYRRFDGNVAEAFQTRRWESCLEGPRPDPLLAVAHAQWVRARRQASKLRSALHVDKLDAERRSELRKPGPSIAGPLTAAEVLDGIQERRAA